MTSYLVTIATNFYQSFSKSAKGIYVKTLKMGGADEKSSSKTSRKTSKGDGIHLSLLVVRGLINTNKITYVHFTKCGRYPRAFKKSLWS